MITKLKSYSHPEYRKFSDKDVLKKAIENKQYIFDKNRKFEIEELKLDNKKIPNFLKNKNIFDYLININQ